MAAKINWTAVRARKRDRQGGAEAEIEGFRGGEEIGRRRAPQRSHGMVQYSVPRGSWSRRETLDEPGAQVELGWR